MTKEKANYFLLMSSILYLLIVQYSNTIFQRLLPEKFMIMSMILVQLLIILVLVFLVYRDNDTNSRNIKL